MPRQRGAPTVVELPSLPSTQAGTAQRYAVLFRGEAFRWGCSFEGVALQQAVAESHLVNIIQPLESRGHAVRLFLAYDHRMCKPGFVPQMAGVSKSSAAVSRNWSRLVYHPDTRDAIDALAATMGRHRVAATEKISNIKDQPDSVIRSLNMFVSYGQRSTAPFDYLIITRYDVRLLSPIVSWACYDQPGRVSAASKCEPGAWQRFHCIADHFWIVPRPFLPSFSTLLGTRLNLSHYTKCCFSKRCIQKAGHGCYAVLTHHWGDSRLGFCWPQPEKSVAEANPNYQCCKHGKAAVATGALSETTGD